MSASSNPNNTNSRQDNSAQRLRQLNNQLDMSSNGSVSAFGAVQQAPEDPLFGLMAAYRADKDPKKVDLGIGAYRDNNAVPWILPVVKKVRLEEGLSHCSRLTILPTGRRHPPLRPRPQPRVSPHRRSRRLHIRLAEAHLRRRLTRHLREACHLPPDHLRHWCQPPWWSLPPKVLQPLHIRSQDDLPQFANMGKPQPDLLQRPPSHQELPILQQGDQGS